MALSKAQVAQIRIDINAALAAVSAKHGMDFTFNRITFTDASITTKLVGVTRENKWNMDSTVKATPEMLALRKSEMFLLGKSVADAEFRSPTLGRVTFVGYNSKAHRYPFIVQQVGGKRYKLSTMSAKALVA